MKFTENFKTHIIPGDQRYCEMYYMDHEIHDSLSWGGEGEIPCGEVSVNLKKLVVELKPKTISSNTISREHITDLESLGIDLMSQTRNAILNEWEVNHEKDLFKTAFDTAITMDSSLPVSGLKGWIFRMLGFQPKIYASHPSFLHKIHFTRSKILSLSRMGAGNWVVVSRKAGIVFDENPSFIHTNENRFDNIDQINLIGTLNGLRIYTSHLIKDNWILMGRSPVGDHDKTIFTAMSEGEWLSTETMNSESMTPMQMVGLRKLYCTQVVPGGEVNYAKWEFDFKKETFWSWLKHKIVNNF